MTTIHINRPRWTEIKVRILHCPTCNRRRKMLTRYQEYYGCTVVCLSCGETWTDGERHERPFCPGWRKEAIEKARAAVLEMKR